MLLVHRVRTMPGGGLEPVGVWAVDGENLSNHYPPEFSKYEERGWKALLNRPNMPMLEWVSYKAGTSPNWQLLDAALVTGLAFVEPSLADVYGSVRAEFAEAQGGHERVRGAASVSAMGSESGHHGTSPVIVRSWGIAAELVRRHPELLVYEMHPGGGMYDVLCIATPDQVSPGEASEQPKVMLNREGSIHVLVGEKPVFHTDWESVLVRPLRESVSVLESATAWGSPEAVPSSTPRSLAYRFLATSVAFFSDAVHEWDVRSEFMDSSGDFPARPDRLAEFPSALEAVRSTPRLGIHGEPHSHFWSLMRGGEALAVVSVEGQVHWRNGSMTELSEAHQKHGRRMRRLTATLLRKWM